MKIVTQILFCLVISGCGRSNESKPFDESCIDSSDRRQETTVPNEKMIPKGRCDLTIVSRTDSRINLLREEDIYEFLFTFSKDCERNVEFSEFSNDVLFKVLLKYPEIVSVTLNKDSLYNDVIFRNLESPISDYPTESIRRAVEILDVSDSVRFKIMSGFKN